jgi:HEPN domain-containing protein
VQAERPVELSMKKETAKWYEMAGYDCDTAEAMLETKRYVYTIFMCHLTIEKALKGLYWERRGEFPPKTHNLLYFVKELGLSVPGDNLDFVGKLSDSSIVTRYPEDLQKVISAYPRTAAEEYLRKTKEVLEWLRKQLPK